MPKLKYDTSTCLPARGGGKRWAQVLAATSCLMAMMAGYCASEPMGAAARDESSHRNFQVGIQNESINPLYRCLM